MSSYVSIHTWPVVTLKEVLFGFVDAIVPNKFIAMGICKSLLFKGSGEKNDKARSSGQKVERTTKGKLFTTVRSFEGTKKVGVNPVVRFCRLWQIRK